MSDNTRKDIIDYYKIPPERITTAYHASSFGTNNVTVAGQTAGPQVPSPYLLFVGSRGRYKNFIKFVTEIGPVLISRDLRLIAAGGGPLSAAEVALLKKNDIFERTIALPSISDSYLQSLYRHALVFVFPSLYEGFGIPVLEAMQHDCPVLASNNSSLPEIGGNAAAYFDPFETGDLREKLSLLLENADQRKKMIESGRERVKQFSWDKTAQTHIEVYKKILGN